MFSSIARLTESINANGQPQTPSLLPSTVTGQILKNFGPPLDMDDIVKLKMYWCDKPDFAKLFIDMSARRMLSNNDEIEPECLM